MRYRVLIQMLCLAGLAHSVYADEIIFTNGDRLTGKIAHIQTHRGQRLLLKHSLLLRGKDAGPFYETTIY